jgi:transcriptional regulator with XRE-family HTH domain
MRQRREQRRELIELREARGLNRVQLAEILGLTRGFVHDVEVGKRNPSLANMHRWVRALGKGASSDLFLTRPIRMPKSRPSPDPARDDAA